MTGARLLLLALAAGGLLVGARPPANARCDGHDARLAVPAGIVPLGEDGPGRPGDPVAVDAFAIDRHEVTNRQFAAFVAATGHVTQAEREGGSAVFVSPAAPVPLDDAGRWWRFVRGVDWRHPAGPGGDPAGRADLPVVHVTRADAAAYAAWAGGRLPSAAEWERAARGAQHQARAPLDWAFHGETPRANVWTGIFPVRDTAEDGYAGLAPAGCFEGNGFGLVDMIGNAWEWVADGRDRGLVKGGSYLCARAYCANFRPAGFQAQEADLGTSHIGFRVAYDEDRAAL